MWFKKEKIQEQERLEGILILDYEAITNDQGEFYSNLIDTLPQLHQQGLQILLFMSINNKVDCSNYLDTIFSSERSFLQFPGDISYYHSYSDIDNALYTVLQDSKYFNAYMMTNPQEINLEPLKGHLLFVCSQQIKKEDRMKCSFPILPVPMIKDNDIENLMQNQNFFQKDLIDACTQKFAKIDRLTTLPNEVINQVCSFIGFGLNSFFSVNKKMSSFYRETNINNRPNLSLMIMSDFSKHAPFIANSIQNYIDTYKSTCTSLNWTRDYGFLRAIAFQILFETSLNQPKNWSYGCATNAFKLLGLYVLLTEKNGIHLKKAVQSKLPYNILPVLKATVLEQFQLTEEDLSLAVADFISHRDLIKTVDYGAISRHKNNPNEENEYVFTCCFKTVQDKLEDKEYPGQKIKEEKLEDVVEDVSEDSETEQKPNCIIS